MRKTILSVLMIPLLLLAGCGGREAKPETRFAAFREEVMAAPEITVRASLTADYGESVETYVLDASYDGRQTEVTVIEPALLSGVRASARWGETELSYGGVIVGAGALDADGLSPLAALPAIFGAMAGGGVELVWKDGDAIAARLYAGEDSRCTVWLDPETLTPFHAEISSGGRTVISCELTDWTVAE